MKKRKSTKRIVKRTQQPPSGHRLKLVRMPVKHLEKMAAYKKKMGSKKGFSVEEQIRAAVAQLPQVQ